MPVRCNGIKKLYYWKTLARFKFCPNSIYPCKPNFSLFFFLIINFYYSL
jgi:hypothetical protein